MSVVKQPTVTLHFVCVVKQPTVTFMHYQIEVQVCVPQSTPTLSEVGSYIIIAVKTLNGHLKIVL